LIDVGSRNAGVSQRVVRDADYETLDGFGIELAERRVRPSDDAGCHGGAPLNYGKRSGHELITKFVLDVTPDNVVEGLFGGGEAEFYRPLGFEIARPAIDNAHNERVWLALDPPRYLVSCHPLQGCDFLADGCRKARHGEVAARTGRCAIHGRGVNQETDRRARRGMPVADVLGHRQHRLLSG